MEPELGWKTESEVDSSGVDVWSYLDVIWRRRWLMIIGMVLAVTVSVYSLANEVPVFSSTARILIEPPASNALDLGQLLQTGRGGGAQTQTQLRLLDSRSFIEQVIQRHDLLDELTLGGPASPAPGARSVPEANPSLGSRAVGLVRASWEGVKGLVSTVGGLFGAERQQGLDENVLPAELRNQRLTRAIGRFRSSMRVEPVQGTHLVDITWRSVDPVFATQMANTVADAFVTYNLENRAEMSQQAENFLASEITRLQQEIRTDESDLDDMRQRLGIDDAASGMAAASNALASELASARSTRIAREAEYRRLQSTDPADSQQVQSDADVRAARNELTRLVNEREELSRRMTDAHPQMVDLQERITEAQDELSAVENAAYQAALRQLDQDVDAARSTERRLGSMIAGNTTATDEQYSELIELRARELDLQNKRNMLDQFTTQKSSLDLTSRVQGYQGASIQVIDPAVLPLDPSNKRWLQAILVAMLIGGGIGALLALALDYIDNTVRSPEDVKRRLKVPTLGTISVAGAKRKKSEDGGYVKPVEGPVTPELVTSENPRSRMSEEYRELRTALLLSTGGGPPRSLVLTSATPGEGKTTSTVNLAISMADAGKKVLLVDGDLRRPRLAEIFGIKEKAEGFSSYLAGNADWKDLVRDTRSDNLWLLPSGPIPPNPAELFGSDLPQKFLETAQEHFDLVLVDSPPALIVVDPLILASIVDGVVVVIRSNETAHQLVSKTIHRLESVKGRVLGVVLNGVVVDGGLKYGRYGSYSGKYRYGGYGYSSPRGDRRG